MRAFLPVPSPLMGTLRLCQIWPTVWALLTYSCFLPFCLLHTFSATTLLPFLCTSDCFPEDLPGTGPQTEMHLETAATQSYFPAPNVLIRYLSSGHRLEVGMIGGATGQKAGAGVRQERKRAEVPLMSWRRRLGKGSVHPRPSAECELKSQPRWSAFLPVFAHTPLQSGSEHAGGVLFPNLTLGK